MGRLRYPSVALQLLAEYPDADLLGRYALDRADDAFAQLVARYSRLVWGQCRNLLPAEVDAEDAFQATFLVLARSAGSLSAGILLGPWLHGVAFKVCKNAQRAIIRRSKRERACSQPEGADPWPIRRGRRPSPPSPRKCRNSRKPSETLSCSVISRGARQPKPLTRSG